MLKPFGVRDASHEATPCDIHGLRKVCLDLIQINPIGLLQLLYQFQAPILHCDHAELEPVIIHNPKHPVILGMLMISS